MTQWEYVKGSEADFEGAPEWATLRTYTGGRSFYAEHHDKGAQIYDICAKDTFLFFDAEYVDFSTISVTAERRKVDNLQSRVNDANLGDALKEMFREDTHGANKDQFAHLNDLPLVSEKYDNVQRPAHYNQSGIECIDAIAASMTPDEFQAYLKGNVQKYLWRYQHKNGVEDCRKAQWYLDRLVKELSK